MTLYENLTSIDMDVQLLLAQVTETLKEAHSKHITPHIRATSPTETRELSVLMELSDVAFLLSTLSQHLSVLKVMVNANYVRDLPTPYQPMYEETLQERCNELWQRLSDKLEPLGNRYSLQSMSPASREIDRLMRKE